MAYIDYNKNGGIGKKIIRDRLNLRNSINTSHSLKVVEEDKNKKYYEVKRLELKFIREKYALKQSIVDFVLKSYLSNSKIPSGSIYNLEKFLRLILKNIYELNEEQITIYINNHLSLFNYSFDDVSLRIAIFYHFGLLDDVIFDNLSYLKSCYPRESINIKGIYAVIMEYNISSLNELRKVFNSIYDEDLIKLVKKYLLSDKLIYEFKEELKSKINKKAFMLELKRRKSLKENK